VLYNLPYIHEWSNDVIEVEEVVVVEWRWRGFMALVLG
jgi:hypothetical protein